MFNIIKQDIHIYMLPIDGETAGPNVDTHGWHSVIG